MPPFAFLSGERTPYRSTIRERILICAPCEGGDDEAQCLNFEVLILRKKAPIKSVLASFVSVSAAGIPAALPNG